MTIITLPPTKRIYTLEKLDLVFGKTGHPYIQVACHSNRILKTNTEYCCHDIMAATQNVYCEQIKYESSRTEFMTTGSSYWLQVEITGLRLLVQ